MAIGTIRKCDDCLYSEVCILRRRIFEAFESINANIYDRFGLDFWDCLFALEKIIPSICKKYKKEQDGQIEN